MSTDVKRVWGKADSLSLEFTYLGQEQWETAVPPDTKDGIYAVELWAVNSVGDIGHWTGELFMCSGVCCVTIFQQPYQIWFKRKKNQIVLNKAHRICLKKSENAQPYKVIMDKRHKIIFEGGCNHVR